jgi:hypothetical protein
MRLLPNRIKIRPVSSNKPTNGDPITAGNLTTTVLSRTSTSKMRQCTSCYKIVILRHGCFVGRRIIPALNTGRRDLSRTVHGGLKVISRFCTDKRYSTRLSRLIGPLHILWRNDCVYPRLMNSTWQPVDDSRLSVIRPLAVRLRYSNPVF